MSAEWKAPTSGGSTGRPKLIVSRTPGVVDPRVPARMERFGDDDRPAVVAEDDVMRVEQVRWPVLEGVHGEGLLLEPKGTVRGHVGALPDAARIGKVRDELALVFHESPDQLAGPAATMSWSDEPYTRGGYAVYKPSQLGAFWAPLRAGTDRIHFAGEHLEALAGYMESAVRSGERVAAGLGPPPARSS